jgi:hypothetical protein
MTSQALKQLDGRLGNFLRELAEPRGRSERAHWARVYVQGWLLDGQRKSVEPMAERITGGGRAGAASVPEPEPWGSGRSAAALGVTSHTWPCERVCFRVTLFRGV